MQAPVEYGDGDADGDVHGGGVTGRHCPAGFSSLPSLGAPLEKKPPEPEASHDTDEQNQKKPEANHIGGSSDSAEIEQIEHLISTRQVKRRRVKITWACIRFSNIASPKETNIFINGLRNTCVDLGMDFTTMQTISAYADCALPTDIEWALREMHEFNDKCLNGKQLGLLIVIMPDARDFDDKVEEVCKELGFTYHCCLPQDVMMLRQEYLNSAAHEINAKVKKREDGDSTEFCDLDEDMGEYCVSSSDEEMSSDNLFYSYEDMLGFERFDERGEHDYAAGVSSLPSLGAPPEKKPSEPEAGHDTHEEKKKKPEASHIGGSSDSARIEQIEHFISTRQVKRRRVKRSWACIRFSNITSPEETAIFINDLRNTCVDIGMDFTTVQTISAHADCALPTDIEWALRYMHELNDKYLNGKQLGLLIVIMPDARDYDEKVEEVCKELGFTYHCCLPQDVMMLRQEYLNSAAHEINAKVNKFCDLDEDTGEYCVSSCDEEMSSDRDSNELFRSYEDMRGFKRFDEWDEHDTCDQETSESKTFELPDGSHKNLREYDGSKAAISTEHCLQTDQEIEVYNMLAGSSGGQPPFEAFLCPVKCECLLKDGWGSQIAYKKPNNIPWDEYSKLFDTDGYYKLSNSQPEEENNLASPAGSFVEHKADVISEVSAPHVPNECSDYKTLEENEKPPLGTR